MYGVFLILLIHLRKIVLPIIMLPAGTQSKTDRGHSFK
jgi:hypothetical protein